MRNPQRLKPRTFDVAAAALKRCATQKHGLRCAVPAPQAKPSCARFGRTMVSVPTRANLREQKLLCDYAAGDAVAGIACGVGLLVVGFRMDNDRCASVAVERMAVAA